MAINFYQQLVGTSLHEFSSNKVAWVTNLFKKKFSITCVAGMCAPLTLSKIHQVVFSMNPSKAAGPNGLSTGFFQKAWPVIGGDFCEAILEFFTFRKLLQEVNSTILTLIPKKKNASTMGDYRPIAYCNIVYKCITKTLANRMILGLEEVISSNQ
jgi:hypothetical protein